MSRIIALLKTDVSSIATILTVSVATLAADGIWMFQLGSDYDAYIMLGFEFFLLGPEKTLTGLCTKAQL